MKVFAYEGAWQIDHIVIVGVGGTGSALSRLVARMLWSRKEAGQSVPTLILVDPDIVESRNVIRQGFAPADVGSPKSKAIALRYSLAYGLPIEYVTEAFNHEEHLPRGSILIDCTDNHLARREIVKGIEANSVTCISAGNHFSYGQIILGGCGDRNKIDETIQRMESDTSPLRLRDGIFCPVYDLPHFGLIYPELLEPEPPEIPADDSCTVRTLSGDQHPLVNDLMANICANYVFKLLHRVPITSFISQIDLYNATVTSTRILPSELRAALSRNDVALEAQQSPE